MATRPYRRGKAVTAALESSSHPCGALGFTLDAVNDSPQRGAYIGHAHPNPPLTTPTVKRIDQMVALCGRSTARGFGRSQSVVRQFGEASPPPVIRP
jgi:hypothetical protein